jgi:hypothetical protein
MQKSVSRLVRACINNLSKIYQTPRKQILYSWAIEIITILNDVNGTD